MFREGGVELSEPGRAWLSAGRPQLTGAGQRSDRRGQQHRQRAGGPVSPSGLTNWTGRGARDRRADRFRRRASTRPRCAPCRPGSITRWRPTTRRRDAPERNTEILLRPMGTPVTRQSRPWRWRRSSISGRRDAPATGRGRADRSALRASPSSARTDGRRRCRRSRRWSKRAEAEVDEAAGGMPDVVDGRRRAADFIARRCTSDRREHQGDQHARRHGALNAANHYSRPGAERPGRTRWRRGRTRTTMTARRPLIGESAPNDVYASSAPHGDQRTPENSGRHAAARHGDHAQATGA